MTSSIKITAPENDPYASLGLHFGASDADIAKAYRQLARTLHPDKLVAQNLTDRQLSESAARFHEIQTARSFLLDVDNAASRSQYDTQRASNLVRDKANQARDAGISEKRKRMRDELHRQEAEEERTKFSNQRKQQNAGSRKDSSHNKKAELARQGKQLREHYSAKADAAEKYEREQAAIQLQERQVRLKWSRTKLKLSGNASPSEDSLAEMLSQSCGAVQAVQFIGDKGNVALVTFQGESSCKTAVDMYLTSEVWRATYVSKVKLREQELATAASARYSSYNPPQQQHNHRDIENVHDWKERRAAERESLLRQMELDDNGHSSSALSSSIQLPSGEFRPFPPSFPSEYDNLISAIDKLEKAEVDLLQGIFSEGSLLQLKVHRD